MKIIIKKYFYILILAFLALSYQNCGDVNLGQLEAVNFASSKMGLEVCTEKAKEVRSNLKFIFVFDRSASNLYTLPISDGQGGLVCPGINQPPNANGECPGTDPFGNRRFLPVARFASNYPAQDESIHWGFINFGSNAVDVMADPSPARRYTSPPSSFTTVNNLWDIAGQDPQSLPACPANGFQRAVCRERATTQVTDSVGFTNYLLGLDRLTEVIVADMQRARAKEGVVGSMYVIFFVSDGAPYVEQGGTIVLQNRDDILRKIRELQQLRRDNPLLIENIQFNTAYYYETPDQTARALLQEMSATGRGAYLEFGAGANIDFSQFTVPTRVQKFNLRDIFVTNANTLWHEGRLLLDRDADLMPDDIEAQMGSSAQNADSDGNGVRDGIEWRVEGSPCGGVTCAVSGRRSYAVLCGPGTVVDGRITYPDRDFDLLNDCEERLLGSDELNFDSNLDGIPDHLALKVGLSIIPGSSNDLSLNPDNDDLNNYNEIKRNTPLRYPNHRVAGLKYLDFRLNQTLNDAEKSCYQYSVDNLATLGEGNELIVYALEGSAIVSSKLELKIARRPVLGGTVSINKDDFRSRNNPQ
jgi:hypothetical protein